MAEILWERPGIRIVQGVSKSGAECWVNWHFAEIPLGEGLNGPPIVGGEYTAYRNGERVGGVFRSLADAEAELEKVDTLHAASE